MGIFLAIEVWTGRFTRVTMEAVYNNFHLVGVINGTPGQEYIYANNRLTAPVETFIRLTMPTNGQTQRSKH